MKRGFKAEAERLATRLRGEMGVSPATRLDVDELAKHLGISVRSAEELVSMAELQRLEKMQPGCFSAATFYLPDGRVVAVTNPLTESRARRDSDLAHELAHFILKHTPAQVDRLGDLTFFDCNPEQEKEANWLAGCLLLPRPLLLKAARQGLTPAQVAEISTVSIEMAQFRLNTSGVYLQARRASRQFR